MSPEVCPFCGRPFKRLKSHLPHCKAANERSPPAPGARHEPSKAPPMAGAPTGESGREAGLSAPSPPASVSKPKGKGARSSTEAVRRGPPEATSSDPLLDPGGLAGDPRSRDNLEKDSQINRSALLPADAKPKGASKAKRAPSETKAQSPSPTRVSGGSRDSGGQGVGDVARPSGRALRQDLVGKRDDRSEKEGIWGGHQGRVTLQGVKASLGRHGTGKPSALERRETATTEDPPGENQIRGPFSQGQTPNGRGYGPNPSSEPVSQAKQVPGNASHALEGLAEFQQPLLLPRQNEVSPRPVPTPSPSPQTPFHCSTPPPLGSTDTNREGGVTMDAHRVELLLATHRSRSADGTPPRVSLSPSLTCPCPSCPLDLSAKKENGGAHGRWTAERPELRFRKPGGALTDRSLGRVTLRELPEWLAVRTPGGLGQAVDMLQGGWRWYYRKYIDVRKGGVGGVGMLLVGYCVLSYAWSYPHIRRDCWRKYH